MSADAVRALQSSLRKSETVRTVRALPAKDGSTGPAELRRNAYYVTAALSEGDDTKPQQLLWLATKAFLENGQGTVVPATDVTLKHSLGGTNPDKLGISFRRRGLQGLSPECPDR